MPNSGVASGPPCPVCGGASQRERRLSPGFLTGALEAFVEAPLPAHVAVAGYAMCRCVSCTLEFADPAMPAGDAFYAWLDRDARYYVAQRWEWDRVAEMAAAADRPPAVLEIGAGDGRFLRRLRDELGARCVAIERSAAAVAALRARGVEAHAQADAAAALAERTFDFVVAFHCLEHVPDPVALLHTMRTHAGAAGRVLFSVPYSPMYFERRWFDPLNHPPHHLTRWNARALGALAAQCGGVARLHLPAAYDPLRRARYALAIAELGPHWMRRRAWRWQPLRHPARFAAELWAQLRRERVAGRPAADVVLVEVAGGPRPAPAGLHAGARASTT